MFSVDRMGNFCKDGQSYVSEGLGGHFNPSFVAIHDITNVTLEGDTNFPRPWNFKPFPRLNKNPVLSNPSSIAPDLLRHLWTAHYTLYEKHHKVSFSHYLIFDICVFACDIL